MKKCHSAKIIIPVLAGIAAVSIVMVLLKSQRHHYLDEHESFLGGDDSQKRPKLPKRTSRHHPHYWV